MGLQKLGKGDWRGIARNYVVSRTPTQVASHAQKYFIRQTNVSRRKRRSSLFDIVAGEVCTLHPSFRKCIYLSKFSPSYNKDAITLLKLKNSSCTVHLVSSYGNVNNLPLTLYISPSPPLVHVVRFGLSLSGFPSRFLKCVCPHPYKGCFVLLSNRCGISQSTSLRGLASSLTLVSFSN